MPMMPPVIAPSAAPPRIPVVEPMELLLPTTAPATPPTAAPVPAPVAVFDGATPEHPLPTSIARAVAKQAIFVTARTGREGENVDSINLTTEQKIKSAVALN